ncbi:MAG: hypothetical protein KGJ07_09045, partial [Patescibacteria group bacterium]|nr:hypothetical protein [Patescibacteria group bacterium]
MAKPEGRTQIARIETGPGSELYVLARVLTMTALYNDFSKLQRAQTTGTPSRVLPGIKDTLVTAGFLRQQAFSIPSVYKWHGQETHMIQHKEVAPTEDGLAYFNLVQNALASYAAARTRRNRSLPEFRVSALLRLNKADPGATTSIQLFRYFLSNSELPLANLSGIKRGAVSGSYNALYPFVVPVGKPGKPGKLVRTKEGAVFAQFFL